MVKHLEQENDNEAMTKIEARRWWNDTPLILEQGKVYCFSSDGKWHDGYIRNLDASGYSSPNSFLKLSEGLRRKPDAKWFSLIGTIDRKQSTQFDIGKLIESKQTYTATATGRLSCFANDLWILYFNNSGYITLSYREVTDKKGC